MEKLLKLKLKELDSLEVLTCKNNKHEFPNHFHQTYAISIIENGVFGENHLLATKGSIVISHPNEVHENRLVYDNTYSFTTFYVNPDVIKYISKSPCTSFAEKVIYDEKLFQHFKILIETISSSGSELFISSLYEGLNQLILSYGLKSEIEEKIVPVFIDDATEYIDQNYHVKIRLEELAERSKLSKYQFIRQFRKHVGITPFEYINLQRVSRSKQLLLKATPIIDVALDTGFYDQSHFNKYFKRFVGLSPLNYQRYAISYKTLASS